MLLFQSLQAVVFVKDSALELNFTYETPDVYERALFHPVVYQAIFAFETLLITLWTLQVARQLFARILKMSLKTLIRVNLFAQFANEKFFGQKLHHKLIHGFEALDFAT